MKKIAIILLLISLFQNYLGQCYLDRHNTTWYDGWISCQTSPSPNPARGNSHWVQYNLGESYVLHELFIWNTNAPDLLDWGMQEIAVDVSFDGITWTEIGTYTLNQATGFNRYEGEFITDLNSVKAQYVLITGLNNYGGACYGLSEVKINVDNTVGIKEETCIKANVYPNPFNEKLTLSVRSVCTEGSIFYSIVDALGRVIIEKSIINTGDEKNILLGDRLEPGIYFIMLQNGQTYSRIKVIKN